MSPVGESEAAHQPGGQHGETRFALPAGEETAPERQSAATAAAAAAAVPAVPPSPAAAAAAQRGQR